MSIATLWGATSTPTSAASPEPDRVAVFETVSIGDIEGLLTVDATDEIRITDPDTGAQKGSKPERHDLIPIGALKALALVYGVGAQKYDDHNWRAGYRWSLSYAALQRHLTAFWNGEDIDPESGLPHMAHAAWHCFTLITFMHEHPEKDDRYDRTEPDSHSESPARHGDGADDG